MRITLLTVGSRGHVQPYIALGLGLKAAGHSVRLATHATFRDFVTTHGLDFAPLAGDPKAIYTSQAGSAFTESDRNSIRLVRKGVSNFLLPILPDLLMDSWNVCQGTDAIISTPYAVGGYHVAEKLNVPFYGAFTCPLTRTRAFPHPFVQLGWRLGGTYNQFTYRVMEAIGWQSIKHPINQWRQGFLGLPPILPKHYKRLARQKLPVLYGVSPTVIPKPADWHEAIHLPGYWFLEPPKGWQPPADLVDFLANGAPPVYIGFGSLVGDHPQAITDLVLEALRRSGLRGILDIGWGGLSNADLPDYAFAIDPDQAPHEWLLPQMAAVVHHGGAGSVAASLRAGRPSIVVAPFSETFFWGERLAALGVGLAPIWKKQISAKWLADALQRVTGDRAMQARAVAIAEQIRAEDGVANAVAAFHHHLPMHLRAGDRPVERPRAYPTLNQAM